MSDMDPNNDRNMLQWAVSLMAAALFLMGAFQTFVLLQGGDNLVRVRANQEKPVAQGQELQKKVEDLAGRVASLAEGGNANAKNIVDAMARQGVQLKVPGSTPPAAAPAK